MYATTLSATTHVRLEQQLCGTCLPWLTLLHYAAAQFCLIESCIVFEPWYATCTWIPEFPKSPCNRNNKLILTMVFTLCRSLLATPLLAQCVGGSWERSGTREPPRLPCPAFSPATRSLHVPATVCACCHRYGACGQHPHEVLARQGERHSLPFPPRYGRAASQAGTSVCCQRMRAPGAVRQTTVGQVSSAFGNHGATLRDIQVCATRNCNSHLVRVVALGVLEPVVLAVNGVLPPPRLMCRHASRLGGSVVSVAVDFAAWLYDSASLRRTRTASLSAPPCI